MLTPLLHLLITSTLILHSFTQANPLPSGVRPQFQEAPTKLPTPIQQHERANPTPVPSRASPARNACVSTVEDRGPVYLDGLLFDPCTSTSIDTSQSTPIVVPISTTPVVTTVPNPMHTEGKMMLWEDLPKRDDMAKMPAEYRTIDHWKEISAVTNAIINMAPWWIPAAVFGSPRSRYLENTKEQESNGTGETKPFVRLDLVDSSRAIVPLTLFSGGDHPLAINVTFDITPVDQGVGWHRAIAAAFEHTEVVERLRSVNPLYVVPGDDNNGNKFRTMAIMEMLTGLSVELAEKEDGADVSATSTIIKSADQTSLTSWLYGNLGTSNDRNPLRWNPTVTYFSGGKLEPILMNSTNAARFSVQDCRAIGPDYFDDFTPDWDLDAFQVDSIFVWAARLKDLELDLNKAEYRQMIESRSAQTAYFEYGTRW